MSLVSYDLFNCEIVFAAKLRKIYAQFIKYSECSIFFSDTISLWFYMLSAERWIYNNSYLPIFQEHSNVERWDNIKYFSSTPVAINKRQHLREPSPDNKMHAKYKQSKTTTTIRSIVAESVEDNVMYFSIYDFLKYIFRYIYILATVYVTICSH